MNGRRLTDAQISRALRAHLPERAEAGLRERILVEAESTAQRQPLRSFLAALSDVDLVVRGRSLVLVAVLLMLLTLAIAAGVGGWLDTRKHEPDPLNWTPASLGQDWPAPVRSEPVGGAIVVPPMFFDRCHMDRLDDIGPSDFRWLDIAQVRLTGLAPDPGNVVAVRVDLATGMPSPVEDPTERWIAYGLVMDTNGDGVPDVRLGIDNIPATAMGEREHRAWRTDLHTGRTESAVGAPYGAVGDTYFDTFFPGEWQANLARFGVVLRPGEPKFRFYAWASAIEDGRVVATDYAPDVGWLDADPYPPTALPPC